MFYIKYGEKSFGFTEGGVCLIWGLFNTGFTVIINLLFRLFFYLGNKSKANRKTSQMKKAKQQQQIRSPVHNENEPDISNEENESYLEGKI